MKYLLTLLLALLFVGNAAHAQRLPPLEVLMQGYDFIGHSPENPRWSADNKQLYFDWKRDSALLAEVYASNSSAQKPRKLSEAEVAAMQIAERVFDNDRRQQAWAKQGQLFYQRDAGSAPVQLTRQVQGVSRPRFTAKGDALLYQTGGQWFAWSTRDGSTRQLTQFQSGKAPEKDKSDRLRDEQYQLFEVLTKRKAVADSLEARRERLAIKLPKAIYQGSDRLMWSDASPDGRYIHFVLAAPTESKRTEVPDYMDASGYTRDLPARSKVGAEKAGAQRYGIYDCETDSVTYLTFSQLPAIRQKPAFMRKNEADTLKSERTFSISVPAFNPSGKLALVQLRAHDNKDRWLLVVDAAQANWQLTDHQSDTAWIGGPGIQAMSLGWISEQECWFQSEKTGFSHLYAHHVQQRSNRALTQGRYEILNAQLSNNRQFFYLHSNRESPYEQHFYRLPVKGGDMTQLTSGRGKHEVTLSSDEKWLAILHSTANRPTELYVQANQPSATARQITQSQTPAFAAYNWRVPEIVEIPASDGAKVPARLYKPTGKSNGAAVIFVHGAGYLQNVHQWWSQYYREYMFHHLLAEQGYTVLDIDYRASAGYGRDWRTAIYRYMGGRDLQDQVDGARYLAASQGVDANRIGIYGGSYGGFITLMALTTTPPGTFACGAALRSVTDWAHYNHGYTSNILNTPETDSLAFRQSSPIFFAPQLTAPLLMLHGVVDVNVHYQDVVRYSQRLIEAGKTDWELIAYPVEDHGFVESSSWEDEYRRILTHFNKHLLPK